jgi:hypothetical protein
VKITITNGDGVVFSQLSFEPEELENLEEHAENIEDFVALLNHTSLMEELKYDIRAMILSGDYK